MADFSEVNANRFQDDLRRAAGYKPIIREDLEKAYARYKGVGVKFGNINKLPKSSQTDKALYKKATDDVVKWYKANKKPAAVKSTASPVSSTRIARSQAAAIIRRYGLDPAEIIGWGGAATTGKELSSYWVNNQDYVWRSAAEFEAWLKRAYGK